MRARQLGSDSELVELGSGLTQVTWEILAPCLSGTAAKGGIVSEPEPFLYVSLLPRLIVLGGWMEQ